MKTPSRSVAAVVFDFDGVIVDSEPLHWAAFQEILEPAGLGFSWDDYLAHYLGFDDRDAIREAFRRHGRPGADAELGRLIDAKAAAFETLVAERGVKPYPGVVELIGRLSGRVPLALCSGALRRDIEPILRKLSLGRAFDVKVTADDVAASKPDPRSYVVAVDRLKAAYPDRGVEAGLCVAIEDTPAGIAAARGAGLLVLAVQNSYPAAKLGAAARVVASLEPVDERFLASMVAGAG